MQKDRKKEHRKVVKFLRRVNKQISSDEYLGLNRFSISIWSERMYRFPDGSGVELYFMFKMTDNKTGNSAYFLSDNYSCYKDIRLHMSDFLIRCSSGRQGHYPALGYVAYDVHEIVEYDGRKDKTTSNESIDKWNWTGYDLFGGNSNDKRRSN